MLRHCEKRNGIKIESFANHLMAKCQSLTGMFGSHSYSFRTENILFAQREVIKMKHDSRLFLGTDSQ